MRLEASQTCITVSCLWDYVPSLLCTTWCILHHVSCSANEAPDTCICPIRASPHFIMCCSAVSIQHFYSILHTPIVQIIGYADGERRKQHAMQATYTLGNHPCNVFSGAYSLWWWKRLLRSQAQSSWKLETHRVQIWASRSATRVSQTATVQSDLWQSTRHV